MEIKEAQQILGISPYVTEKSRIWDAYHKLSLEYLPSRNPGYEERAKQEFIKVGKAFAVLYYEKDLDEFEDELEYSNFEEMLKDELEKKRDELKRENTGRKNNLNSGKSNPSPPNPKDNYTHYAHNDYSDRKGPEKDFNRKEDFNRSRSWNGPPKNDNFEDKNEKDDRGRYNDSKNYHEYQGPKPPHFSPDSYINDLKQKIEEHKRRLLEENYEHDEEKKEYIRWEIKRLEEELKIAENKFNNDNSEQTNNNKEEGEDTTKKSDFRTYLDLIQNTIQRILDEGTPKINDSDLGTYQDWKNQLTQLNDQVAVANFQTALLFHIQKIREEKIGEQKTKENFEKINNPNATEEEKKVALDDIEKKEGQKFYEQNRDQAEKAKKEQAKKALTEYRNKVLANLPVKLAKYQVEENELDTPTQQEIQQLKNGEISEPEKLVEAEMRIIQKIGKKGAEKKITNFTQAVNLAQQSQDQTKIEQLKTELTEFISSTNAYYQGQMAAAQALLNKLQNPSNRNDSVSPSSASFPFEWVIPLSLFGLIFIIGLAIVVSKKKRKSK